MKLTKVTSALSLAALATLACAGAMAQGQDSGWYGGANVGRSAATIDDERINRGLLGSGFSASTLVDDDRSTGYKIFGGYQLNRNFAVEGGYFDLGNFGYTATTVPAGTLDGRIKLRGLNLDLVGTVPLSEKFSVFGRAGLNYAQARDSFSGTGAVQVANPNPRKNDTNYKLGLGLQYALSESLAVRAEAERYRINDAIGNRGHIDLFSVGLIYRFGAKSQAPAPRMAAAEPVRQVVAVAPPPPAPPPAPRFEKYTLSATELFAFDSAELRMPQARLDEIASALGRHAEVNDVVITGYTDRIGSSAYNQKLSERRAVAVKTYLASKGVGAARLKAQGKGEADPVMTCTERQLPALIKCLEPNRRVEVENITIERRVQ
ncbi:outer membrane beta-barrel protein [Polaromonas sp. CG_9.11]|uniref:outer membrane beta-barrel protein n=1 Tax=Polaromonas sp. CG_9.11 TaxID=2787730 RepID=UPI0018C9ACD7|nr:outer membrane beta-barrel protein [Polaromonas sp. CG_9.11]MBG6076111.1 OOP family OmpA-OmpF porin [Polaromonas sp. CG_9.11]